MAEGADALPWFGTVAGEGEFDLYDSVGYGGFPQIIDRNGGGGGGEGEGEGEGKSNGRGDSAKSSNRRQSTVWSTPPRDDPDKRSLSSKVRQSLSSLRNSLASPRHGSSRAATPTAAPAATAPAVAEEEPQPKPVDRQESEREAEESEPYEEKQESGGGGRGDGSIKSVKSAASSHNSRKELVEDVEDWNQGEVVLAGGTGGDMSANKGDEGDGIHLHYRSGRVRRKL